MKFLSHLGNTSSNVRKNSSFPITRQHISRVACLAPVPTQRRRLSASRLWLLPVFPTPKLRFKRSLIMWSGKKEVRFFFWVRKKILGGKLRIDWFIVLFLAPTFADQEMLPQTAAFVLETFRWRPVSAGGMLVVIIQIFQGSRSWYIYTRFSRICS